MVLILTGNALTILSIVRHPRLKTASNQFVLGLAIADILVGLTMPYHMAFYLYPSLGKIKGLCLLRFVIIILGCSASILHLIAIAVDRYLAIVHPLRHSAIVTKRVARRVIACSWLFSICIATVIIYWNNWNTWDGEEANAKCELAHIVPKGYIMLVVLPLFTLLLLILLLTYAKIQRVAAKQARRLSSPHVHLAATSSHWHAGRKSLQVVSLVLGCFCISWLPYLVIVTMLVHEMENPPLLLAYKLAFSFAMANSCMNPFIYAWKNKDFKYAFREILSCGRRKREETEAFARPNSLFRHSMSTDSNTSPVFSINLPDEVTSTNITALQ